MTTAPRPCISTAMPSMRIHWGDHVAAALSPTRRLFGQGWGDETVLASLTRPGRFDRVSRAPEITWRSIRSSLGLVIADGEFASCVPELPREARTAHVRWLGTRAPIESTAKPVYVVL